MCVIGSFFLLPHTVLLLINVMRGGGKLETDFSHYKRRKGLGNNLIGNFIFLFLFYQEFRNIFFMRVGKIWRYVLFWFPPLSTLHIWTKSANIGGGLYIGHGWGTVINARRIGENCVVWQNCTIGSRNLKEPIIEDNVSIWAHAVVIGDITIGSGTHIGAGSVVVKSVPCNSVVVPAKSAIIRKNGERCLQTL